MGKPVSKVGWSNCDHSTSLVTHGEDSSSNTVKSEKPTTCDSDYIHGGNLNMCKVHVVQWHIMSTDYRLIQEKKMIN